MGFLEKIGRFMPSVAEPKVHLNFKTRIMWTGIILLIFLVLGHIVVYGVSPTAMQQFQFLEMILGSKMGSIITLGIGPIVTASIILQLLVGSKIIPWDLHSHEGRYKFQTTQKLLTNLFAVFEAFGYVVFGAIRPSTPDPTMLLIIITQLAAGGILVLFMDEVVSKWGIGSGGSLFIAAGVTTTIFVGAFNPCIAVEEASQNDFHIGGCYFGNAAESKIPFGLIPQALTYLQMSNIAEAGISVLPIIATILVFFIVIYTQAIRVEIPLAFGAFRGFARRWPLKFFYSSNMPVILTAALLANMQLIGLAFAGKSIPILGNFDERGTATGGLLYYLQTPNTPAVYLFTIILLACVFAAGIYLIYRKSDKPYHILLGSFVVGIVIAYLASMTFLTVPTTSDFLRFLGHSLFLVIGSIIFSIFWVSTSGMDAKSVSEQIEGMGMQIPGFRRDPRIIESVLNRYIPPLAD